MSFGTEIGGEDDALSRLAPLLRMRPELEDICQFGGDWASAHEAGPMGWAHFHIVTAGSVELQRQGSETLLLQAGDILLLPHGDAHTVRAPGSTGAARPPIVTAPYGGLRLRSSAGVTPSAGLVCGRLHFTEAPQNLVLAALPGELVLRLGEPSLAARFGPLLAVLQAELAQPRWGAVAIAEDLASALFVMMLRAHLETPEAPGTSRLLRLLGRKSTALAVLAMLRDPAQGWTLDALAKQAAASRASLVRAFQDTVGIAPIAFLAELRLGLARQRLRRGADTLDEIAAASGYESTPAFSRAFLRRYGMRPGMFRELIAAIVAAPGLEQAVDAAAPQAVGHEVQANALEQQIKRQQETDAELRETRIALPQQQQFRRDRDAAKKHGPARRDHEIPSEALLEFTRGKRGRPRGGGAAGLAHPPAFAIEPCPQPPLIGRLPAQPC